MKYTVAYFSGTGSTKLAAERLAQKIDTAGGSATLHELNGKGGLVQDPECDFLIVMYPVYAWGAAKPIHDFIGKLKRCNDVRKAAVISVSAGGNATSNLGCRIRVGRELARKNYVAVYEDMLVMPCNWASHTPDEISYQLINVLDRKTEQITARLLEADNLDVPATTVNIPFTSRIFAALGTFSRKVGFPLMGKCFKASDNCTSCAICADNCPMGNIDMKNGKPRFGWHCIACLRCVYDCPANAISAGIFNSIIVKEGYDIRKLADEASKHMGSPYPTTLPDGYSNEKIKDYLEDK